MKILKINNEHENKAKCIIDSLNEEIEELTSQLKMPNRKRIHYSH